MIRKLRRFLIGSPLASSHSQHELIPKWKALAVLSSDALSSTAYATEEIIIPLSVSGIALATTWSLPIALGRSLHPTAHAVRLAVVENRSRYRRMQEQIDAERFAINAECRRYKSGVCGESK